MTLCDDLLHYRFILKKIRRFPGSTTMLPSHLEESDLMLTVCDHITRRWLRECILNNTSTTASSRETRCNVIEPDIFKEEPTIYQRSYHCHIWPRYYHLLNDLSMGGRGAVWFDGGEGVSWKSGGHFSFGVYSSGRGVWFLLLAILRE